MITLPRAVAFYAYRSPVDMRKQYDTLAALVAATMPDALLDGAVFLFVGRDRRRAKTIWLDGTGVCVLANQRSSHYASCGRIEASWVRAA